MEPNSRVGITLPSSPTPTSVSRMSLREETLAPLILRILISTRTRTFFQPDEYFQALEPAHVAVFGYGQLTWEWLASKPVRSFIFPSVFYPVYWVLKALDLDQTDALIRGPKVLTGIFAALADISVFRLAYVLFGENVARVSLLLSLLSPFNTLALSRSLSNSLETSLTALALSLWPWDGRPDRRLWPALSVSALACLVRPTSAVIWVVLCALHYFRGRTSSSQFASAAVPIALLALSFNFGVDSAYYGHPTFTMLNFLLTNLSSVSLFYGQNPWHYYLTQALPILCATSLPFAAMGWWRGVKGIYGDNARTLGIVAATTITIYSFTGHKEWRFIHPVLPILHVLAARTLVGFHLSSHSSKAESTTNSARESQRSRLLIKSWHLALLLLAFPVNIYVMRYHGAGQIAVMYHLRSIPPSELASVGFLMPCHSTPWQAYLHRPELDEGRLWALGCEPPLRGEDLQTYKDQTTHFYSDPIRYIDTYFSPVVDPSFPPSPFPSTPPGQTLGSRVWKHEWPSHLVLFENLLGYSSTSDEGHNVTVGEWLGRLGYRETWNSGWNGWEGDEKRRGPVVVWTYAG